ncbi:MAG TPA: sialidase family protein [Candidatus Acidoferrales bacterium]|jgi:hypothetical protein|nr:sialidase family protein [Candidatus Acidoferrales bacterium]
MATNVRLSGAQTGHRSESNVCINGSNLLQLAGGCNSTTASNEQFYSSDGGSSWSQSSLPTVSGDNRQGDPAVGWTSDGTAWALAVGIGSTGNVIRSFKSTDTNHQTWTFDAILSGLQTNVDRPSLWIDRAASPYKDNLYALWWDLNTGATYVARRAGPSGTWQAPQQLSGPETTGGAYGGDIKTNAFGDVFAFWPSWGKQKLFVAKSTDGGVQFGAPVPIATTNASFNIGIPAEASRGALMAIFAGAYRTATKDMVYAVWMDLAGGSGCNSPGNAPGSNPASSCKTRIFFSRSRDGAANWDPPVKINDQGSLNDQFHPRLTVDERNGDLVVIYYDTVADSGRVKADVWMQSSTDDGGSWSPAVKITTAQTDETSSGADSGNQYGDYLGLTGLNGQYFACWTDRRSGGSEEIWGAPFRLVQQACRFIINRSTLGQDEIDARRKQPRNTPNGLPVPDAIRVAVDGFTKSEIGVAGPGTTLTVAPPVSGMTITCTGNIADSGDYGPEVQRFTFFYNVDFPDDSAFSFAGLSEIETLNVSVATVSASAQIELIKQPNPFILHGDPAWLSVDLRVFVVRPGDTWFGVTFPESSDATAAPPFIQNVITALTAGQGTAGGQSFSDPNVLTPDEDKSKLYISTFDNNDVRVYNFALARVHYIGLSGATGVRVFFRLFQTQTTYVPFDYPPGGRYRRALNNPHGQPIPLAGIEGGEYVTIPCFAEARIDTKVQGMDKQTDDPNVQSFTAHADGSEVDAYFGCWLDTNQPLKPDGTTANTIIPLQPPSSNVDGPYIDPTVPQVTLQGAITRNSHQCLIAEIAFDGVPIPVGKDPSNWDKLAQRNITWSDIGSAQALTTFEIRPTPAGLPLGKTPDELMIDWGNVPDGSFASIYLPAVNVDDILSTASRMYTTHRLVRVDDHTLGCRTGGVTYIPIPAGLGIGYAGLLSIDPSATVLVGQVYKVYVRQLTNASATPPPPPPALTTVVITTTPGATTAPAEIEWRRVLGGFQLTIPVKVKNNELRLTEERELSVLRWIAESIPLTNRWYPVFHRYLDQIGGRVKVFGGDPTKILPSPTGQPGHKRHHRHHEREERMAFTGKIAGLIFDRFGDFEGFLLDTEECEREFFSREKDIERLVERVWRERLRVTVWTECESPHRPLSIIVRQPPVPFES